MKVLYYKSSPHENWKDWKWLQEFNYKRLTNWIPEIGSGGVFLDLKSKSPKSPSINIDRILITNLKFECGVEWDYVKGFNTRVCPEDCDGYCGSCVLYHVNKVSNGEGEKFEPQYHPLGTCLSQANDIINGERQDQYGNPEDSFALIAKYWQAYLGSTTAEVTAKDVAHMMILFKMARCNGQTSKRDNYVDICGYSSIVADKLI